MSDFNRKKLNLSEYPQASLVINLQPICGPTRGPEKIQVTGWWCHLQAANLRGSCASMNPRLEGEILYKKKKYIFIWNIEK